MLKKKLSGFTLIELLIALTIVAIIAAIALVAFGAQIAKGRDARRKGDLDRIKIALEEYEKDRNCYPLALPNCEPGTGLQPYLNKIPCDPVSNASYYYEPETSACPSWFRLYAKLDYPQDPQALPWCGGPDNNSFNYYVSSPNAPTCASAGLGALDGGGGGGGGGGTPSPTPVGGGGGGGMGYVGCKSGVCVPIAWDPDRPGPECIPNYIGSCYTACSDDPINNECNNWKNP